MSTIVASLTDTASLDQDCRQRNCFHHGVLVDHELGLIGVGGTYRSGRAANYCVLTMKLDTGTVQTAITGTLCATMANGSAIDAEVWRDQVVEVRIGGQQIGTYLNPEAGLPVGFLRSLAIVPALLIVAMIRYDVMNRHVVPRLRRAGVRRNFAEDGR